MSEIISAVKLPEGLTAAVDAWARTHHLSRSEAICKLVNLGLKIATHGAGISAHGHVRRDET